MDYNLSDEPGWVKRYRFAPGTSTQEKLKVVAGMVNQLIQHGKRDRTVRETALKIIKAYNVPAKDHVGEIRAMQKWVQANIRYVFDIAGVETLQTPRRVLLEHSGDCDCSSILLSALLGSIGYSSGVVLLDAKGSRRIDHAQACVKLPRPKKGQPKGWIHLETTQTRPMGWVPPAATRKIYIRAGRN